MKVKKYFNLRPAVFAAVGVCFGIVAAYFFYFQKIFLGVLFCLLFVVLCATVFLSCFKEMSRRSKVLLVMFMSALFVFSGAVFGNTVYDFDNANLNNHYFTMQAKVVDVRETDSGKKLVIDDVLLKGGVIKGKLEYKSYLYVYGESDIDVGSVIEFSAYLCDRFSVYENRFAVNDVLRGIKYTASVNAEQLKVFGKEYTVFERVNLFIRDALDVALDGDEFSVAYALLTGHSEYMDYETITSYRTAGVAHIFAVSGLHIGFLATALGFLLDKLKVKGVLKAAIVTVVLFFYSGVCGFSASSIRASIMSTVLLLANVKGRRYDGLTSISIAAALILCYSPLQFFNVGFQLSFVVVLGIMLLSKPMSVPFKFLPQKLASRIGVAIAAQLVSIALSLSAFGYFSPIAVIINIIFLPAVSVIFIYLLAATIIGGLLSIAPITLFPAKYVLKLVNICILAFDFEKLIIGDFTMGIFALFYYIALVFTSDVINVGKITRIIATSVCILVCAIGSAVLTTKAAASTKIYACGSDTICATIIDSPQTNALILSGVASVYSAGRLNIVAEQYGVKSIDTVIFLSGFNCEEQEILTKLRTVFNLERICYYGEKDSVLELIISKSFGYTVQNYTEGQDIVSDGVSVEYAANGKVADCTIGGKRIAVFADGEFYAGLSGNYDLMICGAQADVAFAYYNPRFAISYFRNARYTDAESQGTAIFTIE